DCYVVLDFEATCWEGRHADQERAFRKGAPRARAHANSWDAPSECLREEIIEFPLVLVDAKTLTQ
ncbi:unnamed protein product, partial [Durusdinium trenchii]